MKKIIILTVLMIAVASLALFLSPRYTSIPAVPTATPTAEIIPQPQLVLKINQEGSLIKLDIQPQTAPTELRAFAIKVSLKMSGPAKISESNLKTTGSLGGAAWLLPLKKIEKEPDSNITVVSLAGFVTGQSSKLEGEVNLATLDLENQNLSLKSFEIDGEVTRFLDNNAAPLPYQTVTVSE